MTQANFEVARVMNVIDAAFKTPLPNTDIIAERHNHKTPLEWYDDQTFAWKTSSGRQPRDYRSHGSGIRSSLPSLLRRAFGHLAANPSQVANVDAHLATYVFSGDDGPYKSANDDPPPVNWNRKTLDEFIDAIVGQSKASGDLARERHFPKNSETTDLSTERLEQSGHNVWAILGEKGVGKTIFLNYMLATQTKRLHKERIIWARVDLTKVYDENLKLESLIRWQLLQILFKYYDLTTQRRDATLNETNSPAFAHWADKIANGLVFDLSSGNRALFEHAQRWVGRDKLDFETFKRIINEKRVYFISNETADANDLSPQWLFAAIWDYLTITCEVSFIFIVDGLDQLGLTKKQEAMFTKWHSDLYATLFQEGVRPASYIVTMRYESWKHDLMDRYQRRFQPVEIQAVPSRKIWRRRVDYLERSNSFSFNNRMKNELSAQSYSTAISLYCDAFLAYASASLAFHPSTRADDRESALDTLDSIFGNNKRKVFEAISNAIEFFSTALPEEFDRLMEQLVAPQLPDEFSDMFNKSITSAVSRFSYLFVESLMLEKTGSSFRKSKYYTIYDDQTEGKYQYIGNDRQEFLFNIFATPILVGVERSPYVLYCLRIVQYFIAEGGKKQKKEALSAIAKLFNYQEDILEFAFNVLVDTRVISPVPIKSTVGPNTYMVMTRGEVIVDALIFQIEYINLALQAAPLPSELVDAGYFPIRRYNCQEYVLFNKIISTVNFCRLLKLLEDTDEAAFNSNIQSDNKAKIYSYRSYKRGKFAFYDQMESRVRASILHIVERAAAVKGPLWTSLAALDAAHFEGSNG